MFVGIGRTEEIERAGGARGYDECSPVTGDGDGDGGAVASKCFSWNKMCDKSDRLVLTQLHQTTAHDRMLLRYQFLLNERFFSPLINRYTCMRY